MKPGADMTDREKAQAAVTQQRLLRKQLDMDSLWFSKSKCWHPVPHFGGGGGSRYYGPSYEQCNRAGVWEVTDPELDEQLPRYCAQHAREHNLLVNKQPIPGVRRRPY